jgi:AAA+ superfamily predicted ATPase
VQWRVVQVGVYESCGPTRRNLLPGAYRCVHEYPNKTQIHKKDLQVDALLEFDDGIVSQVLQEIHEFWSAGEQYGRLGFLHRRGYLFYGPQGAGKSSLVHLIVQQIIAAGHIAFFCDDPQPLIRVIQLFRKVEPTRPVVCVFEDIDAIIEEDGESDLLQWLDGVHQINQVVNIATTNYPEQLDRRIVSRPRRFDRIIRIESTSERIRRAYVARKLPHLCSEELTAWVETTRDLSFAALSSLVIDVGCLGKTLAEAVAALRTMNEHRPSSKEFVGARRLGFLPPTITEQEPS